MRAGTKQTSTKDDHVMHVTYRKEDMHVMPTNLPRLLRNITELEQASSHALSCKELAIARDSHFVPR